MLKIAKGPSLLTASLLTALLIAPNAAAHKNHDHSTAEGIVKERLDFMENMGKAMGGLMAVVRGNKDFDADDVMANLGVIHKQSGAAITNLFPEGRNERPSEALSKIWDDWDSFAEVAGALRTKVEAMQGAVHSAGDAAAQKAALQQNIRDLGTGCRDCHSQYRKKQNR
tara:strand:- start:997 stop:1503 length:507 start_codon:yes stop_codon:yes gene_type:complete